MAADDLETLASLNYYMLEHYYRHVQMITLDATRRYGSDPVLSLYKGISMLAEGRTQESIRELEPLKDKQNVVIAVHYALIKAYKTARSTDRDAIQILKSKIDQMKKNATDMELYFALLTVWFVGDSKDVKELSDEINRNYPQFKQGIVLRAWIDINTDSSSSVKRGLRIIEPVMNDTNKDPFAYIGKARGYNKYGKYRIVMDTINQIVISFPKFSPSLVELMRVHLAQKMWDQVLEASNRLLAINSHHPEALRMQILLTITREGKYMDAVNRLGELIQVIDRFEPQNAELYASSAKLFSRVCGRNVAVLNQTFTLMERAVALKPDSAEYANEFARQFFMMGKYADASKRFQNAMSIDETSIPSLVGLLRCQIIEYEMKKIRDETVLADISDQIEFLDQVQADAEILFLKAFKSRSEGKSQAETLGHLESACNTLFTQFEKSVFSTDSLTKLNPDFVMEIVRELFRMSPTQPVQTGQTASPSLTLCLEIVGNICKILPGLMDATYLRAKAQLLSGDMDGAALSLKHCLQQDETFGDGHLLMAQLHHHKGNHAATARYLESALSFNFEIRDHPLYHLIKSRTYKQSGQLAECIQTLKMALALPGVKRPVSALQRQNKKYATIDDNDRLSIFLELVEAHSSNGEHHEAAKVMQDAMNAFQGTPEEVRVRVANADLSASRGDIEQALSMLQAITPDQPYFVEAKEKMAHIYLRHRKDKKLFAGCYRDLMEKQPSAHTCLLLGDAYISIQEPEKAIEVYEQAMKKNPREGVLASKIGKTLIKTHDYKRAIAYYETAIRNGQGQLRFDLVELLLQLRSYSKAEKVLQQAEEEEATGSELDMMMDETRRLMLLSTLHRESGRYDDELNVLLRCRDTQAKLLKRVQTEQPDGVATQKQQAANICSLLAAHARNHVNDPQQAIKYQKEALIYREDDMKIMIDLAGLFLQLGDLDSCEQYCMQALRMSSDGNDQASMMMADVMFSKKQYKDAIFHYEQLLETRPTHYEALSRLIGLLRRGGQLDRAPRFIEMAANSCGEGKAEMDAGFQYCKAIYEWYSGKPHEALQLFNRARCDSDWQEMALEGMIRICLNPDQQTLGGEVFESLTDGSNKSSNSTALATAERLVKEMKSSDPVKLALFENLVLVSTKHKPNAERALAVFMDICQKKKDYVPALLGMATAYQILKQTPRARNQLKRISKMQWTNEEAEEFEQAWLLLADLYISAGKYDMATELLKKCLEQNKSCCKAYEYLGFIYEKEQSYRDASSHYEEAWKYSNNANPVIGYKLAFNYLKAKRNVDAIEVALKVLAANPDYPKMKRDILDKARASIRI